MSESNQPLRSGQIKIRRRGGVGRNRLQDLKEFKITTLDEAILFIGVVAEKSKEIGEVLSRQRQQQVYAANRGRVQVEQKEEAEARSNAPIESAKERVNVDLTPNAPSEADRLRQLKAVQEAKEKATPVVDKTVAPEPTAPGAFGASFTPPAIPTPPEVAPPKPTESAESVKGDETPVKKQDMFATKVATKPAKKVAKRRKNTAKATKKKA